MATKNKDIHFYLLKTNRWKNTVGLLWVPDFKYSLLKLSIILRIWNPRRRGEEGGREGSIRGKREI